MYFFTINKHKLDAKRYNFEGQQHLKNKGVREFKIPQLVQRCHDKNRNTIY